MLVGLIAEGRFGFASDRITQVDPADVPLVISVARANAVDAWLAAHAPADDPVWWPEADQRLRFLAAAVRMRALLTDLGPGFAARHVPGAVPKGPALAHTIYPRPDLEVASISMCWSRQHASPTWLPTCRMPGSC
jgi:hypothetical protein